MRRSMKKGWCLSQTNWIGPLMFVFLLVRLLSMFRK